MDYKGRASEIFEIKEKCLRTFECADPLNLGNTLHGVICMKIDHRYGALVLFKINDEETEQIIYGTPKLRYPFNKVGTFMLRILTKIRNLIILTIYCSLD